MCLVEVLPPPGRAGDAARHPALGRREERLRAGDRSRSSCPPASRRCAPGMEVLSSELGDTSTRRAARCRSSCSSTTRSTARSAIRPASAAAGLLARAPAHAASACSTEPVHKPKAVVFGPTIVYDAERCIVCTRCVRFCDEVAQGPGARHARARQPERDRRLARAAQLDHDYTLMTEHVCPVGALTSTRLPLQGARLVPPQRARPSARAARPAATRYLDYDPRNNTRLPPPPARQHAGQQVLDVRRGHALVPARRREPPARRARRRRGREPSTTRRWPPDQLKGTSRAIQGASRSCSRRSTRTRTTSRW